MNIEETSLVKGALSLLVNEYEADVDVDLAIDLLRQALAVRKPLHVCEKCLKIGGCEHVKGNQGG